MSVAAVGVVLKVAVAEVLVVAGVGGVMQLEVEGCFAYRTDS